MLTVLCTLAVRGAFEAVVIPAFEATGQAITVQWAPTTLIVRRVGEGEVADVVLVTSEAMDGLVAAGVADGATRVEVARSGLGIAVAPGAPHPDVATVEAFRRSLLGARSVAYSLAGASGIHFGELLERLGIAAAVNARATIIPTGLTGDRLLSGEADLAVQQLSELRCVPGIEIAGPFPGSTQVFTTVVAAVLQCSTGRGVAEAFVQGLRSPRFLEAYRDSGLDAAVGPA